MHRTDRGVSGSRMHTHPARTMGRKPSCTGAAVRRESTAAFQETEDRKVKTRSLFLAGAALIVIACRHQRAGKSIPGPYVGVSAACTCEGTEAGRRRWQTTARAWQHQAIHTDSDR